MKTWSTIDKSDWPNRGEWDNEPDKAHWVHSGLDCLMVRGPHGGWCGYVGVPENHPYFGKDYDDVPADVHGGLTFADRCADNADESRSICHPKEGAANETVWWLGFDCAHLGDLSPKYKDRYSGDSYKGMEYVRAETESLAEQLSAA